MQTADVAEARDKVFNLRLSDDEHARLMRLADHYGVNAAGLVRLLLRKEERELGIEPAPADAPAKRSARKSPPKG